ncbi:hypothetical protein [Bacillus sp. EAC]|uniref:hypothetical protein n=1 Tax=Bacillus sp. EAC TaxID=1978338 RepID=UPI000B446F3C|nr:hypothetical protein [Bacillus sp. EAC]
MFKNTVLFLLTIATIYLIINVTILSKEEKPKVRFELVDKKIPYKIVNFSWGKGFEKDRLTNEKTYATVKKETGILATKGEYVQIHFSKKPENVEILEHTKNKKNYIYDHYTKRNDGYIFKIGSQKGEKIFEVKGIWKGNNYFTYLFKLKIL